MNPVQDSPMRSAVANPPESAMWDEAAAPASLEKTRGLTSSMAASDWLVSLLFLAIDIISWVVIYGVTVFIRSDNFLVGPLEFLLVDIIQLAVICQALFMIGGYDRNNDPRTLTYMAEHILAIAGAAAISSLILYAAATFDSSMKPSRSAVLVAFLIFLPWSLAYRRVLYRFIAKSTAGRAFLVIGSGQLATQFYDAYQHSASRQRLEFVDIEGQRAGEHIAGPASPVIEANLAAKLANLNDRYSG